MGRNPSDALHNYIRPLEEALHCITEAPLAHRGTRNLELGKVYTASLGVDAAVRLKGAPLTFFASQSFKVIADQTGLERGNWRATTVGYVYRFNESRGKQQEVLSFHWNPDDPTPGMIRFPHLPIGPALLGDQTVVRPKDLHHAHIPTERVSLEAIVRLAITEFGVTPIKAGWVALLEQSEEAFRKNRTR